MTHPMLHDFFVNESLNQLRLLQSVSHCIDYIIHIIVYRDGGNLGELYSAAVLV